MYEKQTPTFLGLNLMKNLTHGSSAPVSFSSTELEGVPHPSRPPVPRPSLAQHRHFLLPRARNGLELVEALGRLLAAPEELLVA